MLRPNLDNKNSGNTNNEHKNHNIHNINTINDNNSNHHSGLSTPGGRIGDGAYVSRQHPRGMPARNA